MISKVNIENYKCLVKKEVNFSPLTILAGGNAVGKSSVLQSLLLTKYAFDNRYDGEILTNDINSINLGLPRDLISKDRTSDEIILGNTFDSGESNEIRLSIGDEITHPLSLIINNNKESSKLKCEPFNNFQYLNAERVGPRITSDISSSSFLNVGNKGEYTNHIIHKADLLRSEVIGSMKASKISRFSAHCEGWLNIIIPGTELEVSVHEELNKATIKYKNASLQSDSYVPTATGFGITYVLPIIVSGLLLSLEKGGLLIVENPEAHLHPSGQSRIGKFLALLSSCGVQVIVETHSEHIINGARLQLAESNKTENMLVNFFYTETDTVGIEEVKINNYGELEKWPIGFFDQEKNDLRELLKLRLGK